MATPGEPQQWKLEAQSELRLEAGDGATLELVSGNAELAGVELASGVKYSIAPATNCAVFTYYGAELRTSAGFTSVYTVSTTPMAAYAAVHQQLELRRNAATKALAELPPEAAATGSGGGGADASASASGAGAGTGAGAGAGAGASAGAGVAVKADPGAPPTKLPPPALSVPSGTAGANFHGKPHGPRVLIAGPSNSGKSTLTRILLAYACRLGWAPTYVDCDVGQTNLTVPGGVAASPVDRLCLSVERGIVETTPIAFWTADKTPSNDPKLFSHMVRLLGAAECERAMATPHSNASGCIVNTMGWVDGLGYDLLLDTIAALAIDVVLVIGQDKLHSALLRDLHGRSDWASTTGKDVSVIMLPRSGGVVERSTAVRKEARSANIREYFYGPERTLSPQSTVRSFSEANSMAMPVGGTSSLAPVRATLARFDPKLECTLLAVSFATDVEHVANTNVAGFVHVSKVDMEAETVTLLAPCAVPMPSNIFISSKITWIDA